MGMRSKREVRAEKDAGRVVVGGERGRKPLGMETVKGGRVARSLSEEGMVERTGNVGGVARDPMMSS